MSGEWMTVWVSIGSEPGLILEIFYIFGALLMGSVGEVLFV